MIIGSTAIKYHFPDFPREPKDLDFIEGHLKVLPQEGVKTESLPNPVLVEWYQGHLPVFIDKDSLYTLKISHCFFDLPNNSWNKHIFDVQFLKEKGCKFIPELFYKLFDYWESIHGKRKASDLNMSAEDFFDNALDYPVEHDHLHELLIKHPYFEGQEKPTYFKILKEGCEVDVCMIKFEQLSEKERFNVVIEEIFVMQTERYSHLYYKAAFERMLKKFILHHCLIEEGIWIIQNHKKLLQNIPFDPHKFFKEIVKI